MGMTLKEKAVKGISWNLVEKFGSQGMRFFLGIILARILTPNDYGLIGMISVFFVVARTFVDGGFGQAFVQRKKVSDIDADTMFYTNIIVSAFTYFCLWIAAPYISKFYNEPQLIMLTRVMGLVVLIGAFNMIQMAQITRTVDFKRKTKVTLTATLLAGIAGISAAFYGLGVWALVIQQLSNILITTIGLWFTSEWKPKSQFSIISFKEMFSFGAWILGANIVKKVFDNIYVLVIGKFFPAAELGYYIKAKGYQEMTSRQIALSVSTVSFPIFSIWQDDKEKLQKGMQQFLHYTLLIIVPILISLIVVAKPFVILLLTKKWAPMIPYLQLLCIGGLLYPISLVNFQLIMAKGKSRLGFNLDVLKNSLRIINIAIMYHFGVIYIIVGEVGIIFVTTIIVSFYISKMIGYSLLKQLYDIRKTFGFGLIAFCLGYSITILFSNLWVVFFVGSFTTLFTYIILLYIFNRESIFEIVNMKNLIKKNY